MSNEELGMKIKQPWFIFYIKYEFSRTHKRFLIYTMIIFQYFCIISDNLYNENCNLYLINHDMPKYVLKTCPVEKTPTSDS